MSQVQRQPLPSLDVAFNVNIERPLFKPGPIDSVISVPFRTPKSIECIWRGLALSDQQLLNRKYWTGPSSSSISCWVCVQGERDKKSKKGFLRFESSLAAMKHDFEKAILKLHKAWNQFPTTAKHVEFDVKL